MTRKSITFLLIVILTAMTAVYFAACSGESGDDQEKESAAGPAKIDMEAWKYNKKDDVFYQLGIHYCEKPVDETTETLAVFVPGKYLNGRHNGDGTYTCEIDTDARVNGFSAMTAPLVMPVDTPGYSSQPALLEYSGFKDYTRKGFVVVHAGCRGKEAGAPAGVTDLKAAIRYIRYTGEELPGDEESIFTFGMGGGGAQAAILGASGNSSLYDLYLTEIGALSGISDAVRGTMCWCPVTNLDTADTEYEWLMGSTRSDMSEEELLISEKLTEAYAGYVNRAGFLDEDGNLLKLEESELPAGDTEAAEDTDEEAEETAAQRWQAGSYYEYMKKVIEKSLNNYLKDNGLSGSEAKAYIKSLNKRIKGKWVIYNAKKNKATITSLEDFAAACKPATKGIGAFDQLDAGQTENILFGYGDGKGAHFDVELAEILNAINGSDAGAYATDISRQDRFSNSVDARVEMYSPLYYLLKSSAGYQKSKVAEFWRIRSGIEQEDCALTTEVNLALALRRYEEPEPAEEASAEDAASEETAAEITEDDPADRTKKVDFAVVWGQGHIEAERTGNSKDNFIKWVNDCMKKGK